jgi:glycerol-3-phosphate O-acyltransferase
MGKARVGLLSYILQAARSGMTTADGRDRDVIFVPVGLAYDRVLEDRVLTEAHIRGERRFRGRPLAILSFVARVMWRVARNRFAGFGTAAAAFGPPVSLRDWRAAHPHGTVEDLGADLMRDIAGVVPVVPVPLVAAALAAKPVDHAALVAEVGRLIEQLAKSRAVMTLPPSLAETVDEGLRPLIARRIVTEGLSVPPEGLDLVNFYANPLRRRLETADPDLTSGYIET